MSTTDAPNLPTPPAGEATQIRGESSQDLTVRVSPPTGGPISTPTLPSSPSADARAIEGRPFGRYRLLGELGRGGMGIVWKAWDTQLERVVALKQIAGDAARDRSQVDRFLREARLAAKLSHPNIVAVHDVGEHEGSPYYTSEFIEGRSLEEAIREPSPPARRVAWVKGIADALAYAHDQGVIHRDVKPGNVLLDADGRTRVTDFGLAKEVHGDSDTAPLTLSGQIVGTPSYMSPEQALGRTDLVGPPTDQFSLGVLLYQALVGKRPFDAPALRDQLNRVIEMDPIPPTALNAGVHRDLEAICLKALEKDPARRYATMHEFAADLARFLDGEPIVARPVSPLRRLARRLARNRPAAIAAVVAVLVAVVAIALGVAGGVRRSRVIAADLSAAGRAEESAARADGEAAKRHYADARDAFARVLGVDAENLDALRGIDRVKARIQDVDQRLADARREALQLLEAGRPVLDLAARALYDEHASYADLQARVGVAQGLLQQAIDKEPSLALGHHLMGRAWDVLGWDDRAEACWKTAISLDPEFYPSRLARARLRLMQAFALKQVATATKSQEAEARTRGLLEEAEADLHEAGKARNRTPLREEELVLEECHVMQAYVTNDRARFVEACERGLAAFAGMEGSETFLFLSALEIGEARKEGELYDKAIGMRPKFPLALYARGYWHLERGDRAAAVRDFEMAIEVKPRFVEALIALGDVRARVGELSGAVEEFSRAIEADPLFAMSWANRGSARFGLGEREGGLSDVEEAVRLAPRDAGYRILLAKMLGMSRNPERAASTLDAVLAEDPRNVEALMVRASIREGQGNGDGALSDLDAALASDPRRPDTLEMRGMLLAARGRNAEAKTDFDAALAIDPTRLTALTARALILRALGDEAGAIEDLDAAVAVDARDARLRAIRADVRVHLGDSKGAIEDAEAILALQPGDAAGLYYRGLGRGALEDLRGAIEDLEASLAAGGTAAQRAQAHTYLARICAHCSKGAAGDDLEAAFRHLRAAVDAGLRRNSIETDSLLAPLRSDPRWEEVLKLAK